MRKIGTVLVDKLNVRRQPGSAKNDIIGELHAGDKIVIVDERKGELADWLQFLCADGDGGRAWVAERNARERYVGNIAFVADAASRPVPRIDPPDLSLDLSPWPVVLWVGGGALVGLLLLFWLMA